MSQELVGRPVEGRVDTITDLERFEQLILDQLAAAGLPNDSVFVSVNERRRMLGNVGDAIERLSFDQRSGSRYISKMVAAAAAGLFDAALNYLWDETVGELRRRVAGFDLTYFFDIAVKNSDLRKHLKNVEDLARIDDASLLQAAREIGLLTDIGYQRLDNIRYMRNHASVAHPNQVELTGLDLANWLETCVIQVITTPPDTITADTKKLLSNIRKDLLGQGAVDSAAAFFGELPQDRADTLADGLFGLYVAPARTPTVADNVRMLWPELWPHVSEERRNGYGIRHGRFAASADTDQSTAARELIDLVDGASYLPEATRAVEIDSALDELRSAHVGMDNFYTESAPARRLSSLVGASGKIPESISAKYVRTLVKVYLGNGYGTAFSAEPDYRRLLEALDVKLARIALRAFTEESISNVLATRTGSRKWTELLSIIEPKLTAKDDRALLDAVRGFSGDASRLRLDTAIAKLAANNPAKRPGGRIRT
ncbi:hypothetical protein [Rathayibacter rathayi]|uniref:hypothetical protein n=1 Tax=Rathayibacter rathayi TaxID=33887 RepID=UPI0011B0EA53|nr:hypothetical protein [Rathayibacter rathayi]